MSIFFIVSRCDMLRFFTTLGTTIQNIDISYFADSHGISTDWGCNTEIQWTTIPVSYNSTSINVRHMMVTFSSSCTIHQNNFSTRRNLQMWFAYDKLVEQLLKLIIGIDIVAFISWMLRKANNLHYAFPSTKVSFMI